MDKLNYCGHEVKAEGNTVWVGSYPFVFIGDVLKLAPKPYGVDVVTDYDEYIITGGPDPKDMYAQSKGLEERYAA